MLDFFSKELSRFFFLFAMFPFVSFGTNSWDTQPFFIILGIFALVACVLSGNLFSKSIHLFFLLAISLITLSIFSNEYNFIFIRGLASYTAFFVTIILSITYFKRYGIPIKLIAISNVIYLIAAIVQTLVPDKKNEILDFLVLSNALGSPERGVIGLTPEPTIFASLLFFLSWILLLISDYKLNFKLKLLFFLNIFTILFLAKSTMVFVFLIVAAVFFLAANLKKKKFIFFVIICISLFFLYLYLMPQLNPNSRFVNLSEIFMGLDGNLFQKIIVLINFDASINDRVLNVFFPYMGLIMNKGLPGGLDSFYDVSVELVKFTNGYFWAGLGSDKILSFIGAFIYELSIIGIFCILYFYYLTKDKFNLQRKYELTLLFILLNSSVPVAFPFIPIILALMYHKKVNNYLNQ